MFRLACLLIVAFLGYYFFYPDTVIVQPDGVLVAHEPIQSATPLTSAWQHKGYTITPRARFALTARVLSRARYRVERNSGLVPYDFALGWKEMSDSRILRQLTIKQYMRLYTYRWQNAPPVAQHIIASNSANMHLIPANDTVRDTMGKVRTGHIITLEGTLVDFARGNELQRSSMTRGDTGLGACEIIWVTSLAIRD